VEDYNTIRSIMGVLAPDQVPVLNMLARNFAVFDHWFSDVPTLTHPNRQFFLSATSKGNVLNDLPNLNEFPSWNDQKTIFDQLSDDGISWKLYYPQLVPLTLLTNFGSMKNHLFNLANFDSFYSDLASGNLPDFSFIEPKFLDFPNDYHPSDMDNKRGHSSIVDGEKLLADIYNSLRNSTHNRADIALFITFDEAGGTYDHVPPPTNATPPDNLSIKGQMDFTFTRLGFRVPTIMVSDYIVPETVIQQELQHTSFLRFIRTILNMKSDNLTARDGTAPDIPLNLLFTTNSRVAWPLAVPSNFTTIGDDGTELQDEINIYINELLALLTEYLGGFLGCTIAKWLTGVQLCGAASLTPSVFLFGLILGWFFVQY